jgi:hypothetical protein
MGGLDQTNYQHNEIESLSKVINELSKILIPSNNWCLW